MDNREWIKIYKKVYKIIDKRTPLLGDCGLLCQNACCKGDSEDGMLLFPGEDSIFKARPVAPYFSLTPVTVGSGDDAIKGIFAVCSGSCNRKYRPLSCRIFPYLPVLDKHNAIDIIKDPRAFSVCPLVHLENEDFQGIKDPAFEESLYQAFDYLIQYEGIVEFLKALHQNATEVKLMRDLFLK